MLPDDKWGWAVQGAVQFKTDFIGAGDTLNFQAVYTDGASRYNFQSLSVQSFAMFGGSSIPGVYQSVGLAAVADGAFATGTEIETVKTWGLRGAYNHNWDPYWNSALYGAYAQVQYGNAGKGLICGGLTGAPVGHTPAGYHQLRPGLQRGPDRRYYPLDTGEEPDVLGGHDLYPS